MLVQDTNPDAPRAVVATCECGHAVTRPEWNPYEGVWECPSCGSDMIDALIDVGPADADFPFSNQNPEL